MPDGIFQKAARITADLQWGKEAGKKMETGSFSMLPYMGTFLACVSYTFNYIKLACKIKAVLSWPHANYSC